MGGRAEPVRLLFEDMGVPYEDIDVDYDAFVAFRPGAGAEGLSSNFAPPLLQKISGAGEVSFQISQLAAMLEFVAEEHPSHLPGSVEGRGFARQIASDLSDMLTDGRAPFHAKERNGSYAGQKDDPVVIQAIADFQKEEGGRLWKWLGHFESFLSAAERRGTGGAPFFASREEPTYVDFFAYQAFHGVQGSFPACFEKYPKILELMTAIEGRPRTAEFLESDRRWGLCGDSCF